MFWVKYVVVAILGTVLVYFAAPKLWDRYQSTLDSEDPFARPESESLERRPIPVSAAEPIKRRPPAAVQTPVPRQPRQKPAADGEWHAPGSELANEPNPVSKPTTPAASGAADEAAQSVPPEEPAPEVIVEQGPPRSIDKIPVSAAGVLRWGVIVFDTGAFKQDGKRIPNKAPGGTLIEITDAVMTKQGRELASCWCWSGRRWDGPVLIPTTDLLMFEGGRGDILAEDVDNLMAYYKLNASLIARKEAIEKAAIDANPHAARLRDMSAAYNAKAERVKELTSQRDLAKGAARVKIADELRKLEAVNAKEQSALKRQVDLYNKWKENHAQEPADFEKDREYASIKRKMSELHPKVEMFGVDSL